MRISNLAALATRFSLATILIAACAALTIAGPAQQNAAPPARSSSDAPNIQNSRVNQQPVAGSLDAQLKSWTAQVTTPQWLGYTVPEVAGNRSVCCGNGDWNGNDCGTCRLEKGDHGVNITGNDGNATVMLEGSREIAILFRAENHQITKIRVASTECTLDAGGLPFVWLTNVKPAESVALLSTFVRGEGSGFRTTTTATATKPSARSHYTPTIPPKPRSNLSFAPTLPTNSANKPPSGSAKPAAKPASSLCKKWRSPIPAATSARKSPSRSPSAANPAPSTK